MNIDHMSISRKSVWDQCQNLYRLKYHKKTPSCEPEPIYFLYGKLVHRCAEEYVRGRGKVSLGHIANDVLLGKIFLEQEENGPIKLPDEYKRKLPEHLASIQKLTKQIGTDGEVEVKFEYDLDPPHGRLVTGFIDRVIEKNNNFFLIDYKTSKKNFYRKNARTISKDLQLRTYAKVIQRKHGVPAANIKCALYYLEGGDIIGCCYKQESLDSAEKELLEAYKQIENTPEDKAWGNVGDHCQRCSYKKICSFYRMT